MPTVPPSPRAASRGARLLLAGALAGLVLPFAVPGDAHAATTPERVLLVPTESPATSQTVTWRTTTATAPKVQFTAASGGASVTVDGARTGTAGGGTYYRATLTGLSPATDYRYRVGDGTTWSAWFTFRTAADGPAPFSFLYLGDIQNDITAGAAPVVRAAYADASDAALTVHAGDLVNNADNDGQWAEWFAAVGTDNGASMNHIATPGNHEYSGWSLSGHWPLHFPGTGNGPDDDDLDGTAYYTDYQGVRFISLNSNYTNAPWLDIVDWMEDQQVWLEGVLADNPNPWTVVTFHQPVFANSEGRSGAVVRDYWLDVLEEYDVDLVLQGHDHSYGRGNLVANRTDDPDVHTGPVYVVSVTGPKMYTPTASDWQRGGAEVRTQLGDTQTYQIVEVDGDELTYQAKTADGTVVDAFVIDKGGDGKRVTDLS
ncbi:Predicted phosphohydrolases [Marinactinospora thermotolerans DSM 45154]|uniref:Predicted phosphohydrolases n=1 Tax=Marinactinospora thermotolerans DSM 45154 TaxID=1122192 RepID=A0A1T4NTE9_9ACTN|nr:Predicted phosphohydrolases [Marinactinospora thermotolerans DSM 45154]